MLSIYLCRIISIPQVFAQFFSLFFFICLCRRKLSCGEFCSCGCRLFFHRILCNLLLWQNIFRAIFSFVLISLLHAHFFQSSLSLSNLKVHIFAQFDYDPWITNYTSTWNKDLCVIFSLKNSSTFSFSKPIDFDAITECNR